MSRIVEIKPLTRVEGHGTVQVYLEGNRVTGVQLALIESPRLFEALLVGKRFDELPEIICRICSLCSSVHRVTALLALEKAFGVEVSPTTRLYRELIVNGGQLADHALHLFCLVLPDYHLLAGFSDLAREKPEELKRGLRIKAAGNLIQETVGGRMIHPVNLIPGGMGRRLRREELLNLKAALEAVLPDTLDAYEFFANSPSPLAAAQLHHPCYLAVQGEETALFGDRLSLAGGRSIPIDDWQDAFREQVVRHSHAKQSAVHNEIVTVGALARLNVGMQLASRAGQAFFDARRSLVTSDIRGNSLAQAVEMVQSVERSLEIIETLLASDSKCEKPVKIIPRSGTGSAVCEAPRGVLLHSYTFDGAGYCTAADVITPTAINQKAIERDLLAMAEALSGADEAELRHQLAILVRAYDPCISCAIHVIRR
jgi:coenzyme F420-reducing hydrogenase alpha subunit